jgi:DNA-binding MurR/RpiR family transcriptional regulator
MVAHLSSDASLEERVRARYDALTPSQRRIADFLLVEPSAAHLTTAEIARRIELSQPTVVRLASALDYDGFPALQGALQERLLRRLRPVNRLYVPGREEEPLYQRSMREDIHDIEYALAHVDPRALTAAAERIARARRIYVAGFTGSRPLAGYFHLAILLARHESTLLQGGSELAEGLFALTCEEVVVVVSYANYALDSMRTLQHAARVGAYRIVITDSDVAPPARQADLVLAAPGTRPRFLGNPVAAMSLLTALVEMTVTALGQDAWSRLEGAERTYLETESFVYDPEERE